MCFGNFHKSGSNFCNACKVVRSCKKESLKRLMNEKERKNIQMIKTNTIERFGREKTLKLLHMFISNYKRPVSTYRLTRDFKKFYAVNISDVAIFKMCKELEARQLVTHTNANKARYWSLKV